MRLAATLAAVLAAAGAAAANLPTGSAQSRSCAATTVRYSATRIGIPHVDVKGLTGHLFYYTGTTLMDGRVNGSDGLVIYAGGKNGRLATKILWTLPKGAARALRIAGRQLDGNGSFSERWTAAGGRQFPSIVDVPSAGCWRLTLTSGRIRRTVVLQAVEPRAQPTCDATIVNRGAPPHPRFGEITWMPATPRSSGIAAVLFVGTVADAPRAEIYAGGRAPGGSATKFLWWSPHPGASLRLAGRHLDGPGAFAQEEPVANGVTPPVTGPSFPSIIDVPAPGCWAVIVRTGGRAGLVVFDAVPRS
jgi:hypothetical protein